MAIVKMNQFTLLTFHSHKQELLKQLQVFGDVHFRSPDMNDLQELDFLTADFSQQQLSEYETELEKVRFAVGKLKPYAEKPKMTAKRPTLTVGEFDHYAADYDYGSVCEKIREQDDIIALIHSEMARYAAENDALAAWRSLDVDPAELKGLSAVSYLLGTVNRQTAENFRRDLEQQFDTAYVELLDTVKDDTTVLLLCPNEIGEDVAAYAREQGFTRAAVQLKGVPAEVIQRNEREITELEKKQAAAVDVIRSLAPEYPKLQIALDYFETALERERARRNFRKSDTTLMIEGWVPAEDSGALKEILQNVCGDEFYLEEQAVEKDNAVVPIKLKNNKFVRMFESITMMYSVPRYNELDPTPILTPFYWLFFGMMVGDIGYGLVMLIGTTLALRLFDLRESMKSFIAFFRYLSISTILMGFVYGSAFGVTVFAPVPIVENGAVVGYKAILDSQADITTMLIVSIVIGIVHISVGLLTKTYMGIRDGDYAGGLFDGLLWLIAVLSGIGWLVLSVLGQPGIANICKWVFIISLIGLAATQGRSSPSIGGKIGNGLYGVYGITSYVGDIVSYTRIVALSLSGAYIAYAFNLMTSLVVGEFSPGVVSILRLLFGIVIVVFGQALNLGLSLLGAYVHTCRLQYVEFFGKYYEGGGVLFRPFSFKNDYIHIKK